MCALSPHAGQRLAPGSRTARSTRRRARRRCRQRSARPMLPRISRPSSGHPAASGTDSESSGPRRKAATRRPRPCRKRALEPRLRTADPGGARDRIGLRPARLRPRARRDDRARTARRRSFRAPRRAESGRTPPGPTPTRVRRHRVVGQTLGLGPRSRIGPRGRGRRSGQRSCRPGPMSHSNERTRAPHVRCTDQHPAIRAGSRDRRARRRRAARAPSSAARCRLTARRL